MKGCIGTAILGLTLLARPLGADEIRLHDGEILFGTIETRERGLLRVRQGRALRSVREGDVDRVVAGEDPHRRLDEEEAALAPRDAGGRTDLARYAWRHRLDQAAWRLADAALAIDPDPRQYGWLPDGRHVVLRVDGREEAVWVPDRAARALARSRWGAARRRALSRGGGTHATERAVERALKWLAAHQDADGRMDADGFMRHDDEGARCDGAGGGHHGERVPCPFDGATTGVALMAWLAAGSTPASGPYRDNVARALAWCRRAIERPPASAYALLNFAFCVQAVADAYALTRDETLARPLQRAVIRIVRLQRRDGGWSYYLPIGDVPTTGIAATALALAGRAGIAVPRAAIERVLAFLDARVDPGSGRSEYHAGAERKGYTPTRANTATALAVRALCGRLAGTTHRGRQVAAIRQKPVWKIAFKEVETRDGRRVRAQIGNLYPYLWYYTTLALFQQGGGAWSAWYGGLKKALLVGQRAEGPCAGSWDPLGTYSDSAGRVFVTALCALMLQTPYRHPRIP